MGLLSGYNTREHMPRIKCVTSQKGPSAPATRMLTAAEVPLLVRDLIGQESTCINDACKPSLEAGVHGALGIGRVARCACTCDTKPVLQTTLMGSRGRTDGGVMSCREDVLGLGVFGCC